MGDFSRKLIAELEHVSHSGQRVVVHYGGITFGQFFYTLERFHRQLRIVGNHQGDRLAGICARPRRRWRRRRLEADLLPLAHHYLCAGQSTLSHLLSIGVDPTRISFPEFGVDMDVFRPTCRQMARRQLGLAGHGSLLLHVGRADASRGLPELLQAMPRLGRYRQLRLLCVGVSPEDTLYPTLRAAGAVCTGWVPHERLPLYHNACDVLVRPAGIDRGPVSVGINVAEALACGEPVVSGTLTEFPDYQRCQHVIGGLPRPNLAFAILHVLEQPREELAWQRRESVRAYDWNEWLTHLMQIYTG
jgi:glycosyltransferase involved in cell wall biosynthesis